jgi:alpha-glucosidase
MSRFNQNSLEMAMNELSNHDHSRFLTRTNRRVGRTHTLGAQAANENINKGVFREAVVFQMTWPGAPTIYYGDEAGVCGWTDPDNRRTYPWGHEDKELIAFHRDIIRLHKSSKALLRGSVMFMHGSYKLVAYGRFNRDEAVVVILNNDYEARDISLHMRRLGVLDGSRVVRVMETSESGYTMDNAEFYVQNNTLTLTVPGISATILRYSKS